MRWSWAPKIATISHVTGLAKNERLKKITALAEMSIRKQYLKKGLKVKSFIGPLFCYAKIKSTGCKILTRYYCTNMEKQEAQSLYQEFYTKRGDTSENRIKELKNMCFSDRLSCHKFTANFFRLLI